MNKELYFKLCNSLINIFHTAKFKYIDKQNAYCITCNPEYLLPWITRNIQFSKHEKLVILELINTSKVFINNGPKWYCISDKYINTIHLLLQYIDLPDEIKYKPINKYLREYSPNCEYKL